ncbi:uncharacterized protein An05g00460 [Aspergillus niger]|uniref:Contig An05c0020, genomic contig n=2 Tax=Aspergillus niger TaxID=5061 RepID=A2QKJ7_ASPNC|nr:uncharacterized protein An05g00460 [Aspergillus niger]CAK39080.1 unnamed protein product [Aspergillus niger]
MSSSISLPLSFFAFPSPSFLGGGWNLAMMSCARD